MQIEGKLIKILEAEGGTSKNGNAWNKQSCIIETESKYNIPTTDLIRFGNKDLIDTIEKII